MKKNSFVEGTFIATLAIVVTKILGMLYVIPFYSIIGTQGSALYSYAYNIYVMFLGISSAGIPSAMSKIVSEYDSTGQKEAKVRSFKIGVMIIGILSFIAFLILVFFSEKIAFLLVGDLQNGNSLSDIALVIFIVSFSVLIIPFLSVARGYLQGHKYIKPSSDSQLIEQIVRIFVILVGSYLAIKVFNSTTSIGVAIAISGAFVGGLAAIAYIGRCIFKHKKELSLDANIPKDKVSNKEILKKILSYAIPFVVINLTVNLYNTVDMSLILRTISKLGYTGAESEFVAGVVTTWGYKLNMIVNAIATGLTISLIPSLVSAYTLKKYKEVNSTFNKAIQIVLFVSLPVACGLSFLATPVWTAFYGASEYGPIVFRFSILTAILCNVYLVCIQSAQSLSKYKSVYLAVIGGSLLNALLDVPLMYLCHNLGIYAFYGATIATIIGYLFSITVVMVTLRKIPEIKYQETFKMIGKLLFALVMMIFTLYIVRFFIPLIQTDRLHSIIEIVVYAVVGGVVYLGLAYRLGIINTLFGKQGIKKLLGVLTLERFRKRGQNAKD